jgi:hypothetical protein
MERTEKRHKESKSETETIHRPVPFRHRLPASGTPGVNRGSCVGTLTLIGFFIIQEKVLMLEQEGAWCMFIMGGSYERGAIYYSPVGAARKM